MRPLRAVAAPLAWTAVLLASLTACSSSDEPPAETEEPDAGPTFDPDACPTVEVPAPGAELTFASALSICGEQTADDACADTYAAACEVAASRMLATRASGYGEDGALGPSCDLDNADFTACAEALASCTENPPDCLATGCAADSGSQLWLSGLLSDPDSLGANGTSEWVQPEGEQLCNGMLLPADTMPILGCDVRSVDHAAARVCHQVAGSHFCGCNGEDDTECTDTIEDLSNCIRDGMTVGWDAESCKALSHGTMTDSVMTVATAILQGTADSVAMADLDLSAARMACRAALPFGCARRGVELCAVRVQTLRLECEQPGADPAVCGLTLGDVRQCAETAHPEDCHVSVADEERFEGRPGLPACIPLPRQASGVDAAKKVLDLTAMERSTICRWHHDALGGSGYYPCYCVHGLDPTTVPGQSVCETDLATAFTGCDLSVGDIERCVRWISDKDACRRQAQFGVCRESLSWFACHLMLADSDLPDEYQVGAVSDAIGCTPVLDCLAGVEFIANQPKPGQGGRSPEGEGGR